MLRIGDVVIDCSRPAALARFWAAALPGYAIAPYDAEELSRLREFGVPGPEDDPTVLVEGPSGAPRLWLVRVPEPKVVKNRVHLDLVADDLAAEAERLQSLGARHLDRPEPGLVVLADPEDNEFCVTAEGPG